MDGTYTRILMRVQNLSWRHHPTKCQVYGRTPPVSSLVKARTVQFAGHCFRADKEIISSLLLWKPSQSTRGRALSYPDVISRDTGIEKQDLSRAMLDRDLRRNLVHSIVSTKIEQ